MKQGEERQRWRVVHRVDVVAPATGAGFGSFEHALNLVGDPGDLGGIRGLGDAQIHPLNEFADHRALATVDAHTRLGFIAIPVVGGCDQERITDGYYRRIGRCAAQRIESLEQVWIGDGVDVGSDRALVLGAVLCSVQTLPKLGGNVDVIATNRDRDERVVAVT
jgi:hypothetical protein